jgi:uncharacterized OB-fold protein
MPEFSDRLPFVVALVELVEQRRLLVVSNVVDCSALDLRPDMMVDVVFREGPRGPVACFRPSVS